MALGWGSYFYWQNLRGVWFAVKPAAEDITKAEPESGLPLILPNEFSVSLFAQDLPGARVMVRDSFGNFWVSQTSEGTISLLEVADGKVNNQYPVFENLRKPHGLALDPENPFILYVAEENKISRAGLYTEGQLEKIADLPSGGGHFTRTIKFGPDGRLYVSIGSSCNVCRETSPERASIISMKKDGSDRKIFASGLRNAVFFDWSSFDGAMWATDNGRDLLGDDLPPDEINIVKEGANYGWPICYGKNTHDANFDKNTYIRNPCLEPFETPSKIDLPAHSAPLGLAFAPQQWPEEYRDDLLVAYHGSWNRTEPTGYKVARVKLNERGDFSGVEDFITGWLTGDGEVLGRPVGVFAEPDGAVYVTDDKAGAIYKITSQYAK